MTRVFVPEPLLAHATVELPAETARHLVTVLRLRAGERVTAFDGSGREAEATVTLAARQRVVVEVEGELRMPARESPLHLELGLCLSKGERMDASLQKCVELGAQSFVPLSSERSVVRLDEERWERKLAHWQAVVVAACEQSGRVRIPAVSPPTSLAQWVTRPTQALSLVCTPEGGSPLHALAPPASARVLVGPEGGLSPAEVERAVGAGFTRLRLGPRTLRTETASIACVAAMQALWGDLG